MTQKIKVLIVDDIDATRKNIGKLIGFYPEATVVGEAANAEEAIVQAKSIQPDVILMDINLPGMDGIAAAEILTTEVPAAAIIMMSVQGEPDYFHKAMVAGARNYLVKPFTGAELLQAIKQGYKSVKNRRDVRDSDGVVRRLRCWNEA